MQTATKQVGYAYASSMTAAKLGFGSTGCYAVEFLLSKKRSRGFKTLAGALSYAETQPEPYDFFSIVPSGFKAWMPGVDRNARPEPYTINELIAR